MEEYHIGTYLIQLVFYPNPPCPPHTITSVPTWEGKGLSGVNTLASGLSRRCYKALWTSLTLHPFHRDKLCLSLPLSCSWRFLPHFVNVFIPFMVSRHLNSHPTPRTFSQSSNFWGLLCRVGIKRYHLLKSGQVELWEFRAMTSTVSQLVSVPKRC